MSTSVDWKLKSMIPSTQARPQHDRAHFALRSAILYCGRSADCDVLICLFRVYTMNLRKRRPPGTILPMTTDDDGGTNARSQQRRRRRRKTNNGISRTLSTFRVATCLVSLGVIAVWHQETQNPIIRSAFSALGTSDSRTARRTSSVPMSFNCANGVGRGVLNDDYCDCTDGSDEPNTSACSDRVPQQALFRCHTPTTTTIYTSRVNDGVRDCPDGSDEFEYHPPNQFTAR